MLATTAGGDLQCRHATPSPRARSRLPRTTRYLTGANLTVTAAALSVVADPQSRAYGAANPTLTYVATGLVNGDALTGVLATTAGGTSNVGSYAITQGTLAASANYALTYTGANLTVTAAALSVVADPQSRAYGAANPTLTYVATGLVNGDTLTGVLATTATANLQCRQLTPSPRARCGIRELRARPTGANLTVTAAALSVVANPQSRAYGAANPTLTYSRPAWSTANPHRRARHHRRRDFQCRHVRDHSGHARRLSELRADLHGRQPHRHRRGTERRRQLAEPGLWRRQSGADLCRDRPGQRQTPSPARSPPSPPRPPMSACTPSPRARSSLQSNYALTYIGANLTVTAATLSVVANSQSRAYGAANPALTYVATGLVNGDTLTGALATTGAATSNVGQYAITQGTLVASANYALTYMGANLTVTAAALSVVADSQSRAYGAANPALTYVATGLVNGDTLTGALATTAAATSNVGLYAITQGTHVASANYALTYTGANLTVTAAPTSAEPRCDCGILPVSSLAISVRLVCRTMASHGGSADRPRFVRLRA